jgi:hypothetical protein
VCSEALEGSRRALPEHVRFDHHLSPSLANRGRVISSHVIAWHLVWPTGEEPDGAVGVRLQQEGEEAICAADHLEPCQHMVEDQGW